MRARPEAPLWRRQAPVPLVALHERPVQEDLAQEAEVVMKWRPRAQLRRTRTSPDGRHVQALGLRFGYWPCLAAPFVTIDVASFRLDLWCGLPGYESGHAL